MPRVAHVHGSDSDKHPGLPAMGGDATAGRPPCLEHWMTSMLRTPVSTDGGLQKASRWQRLRSPAPLPDPCPLVRYLAIFQIRDRITHQLPLSTGRLDCEPISVASYPMCRCQHYRGDVVFLIPPSNLQLRRVQQECMPPGKRLSMQGSRSVFAAKIVAHPLLSTLRLLPFHPPT
jgi:hypothetical protein